MSGPTLQIIDNQGIFLADLLGFILSLPVALFLAYWMSAVKRPMVVVTGAFIGSFLGFLIILAWVGTLIFDTVLPGAKLRINLFWLFTFLLCAWLKLRNHSRPDRSTNYRKGLSKAGCRSRVKNEQTCFICYMVTTNSPAGNN